MAKVRVPQWGRLDKFYWVDEVAAASSGSSATTSTAATTTVTNPVAPPLTPPRQTLDKIPDGTAYAKPLSSQLTSGGIDFSKSGFLNKNIDNIGDGMTYLRMPGANMDGNRRALIDFTQGGHLGKMIDNIGDGMTYLRMPGANMDGNRRAWIDFSGAGHLYKHLGNIPDDPTSSRFAVLAVDTNRRPLIDLSQAGHLNKTQDNIADGAGAKRFGYGTYATMPTAGTAGRIYHAYDHGTNGVTFRDTGTAWEQIGVGHLADISGTTDNVAEGANKFAAEHGADITGNHTSALTASLSNQTQDALADGNLFARVHGSRLQNGIPILPSWGRNLAPNELMQSNNVNTPFNTPLSAGQPACDGWKVHQANSAVELFYGNSSGFNSATALVFQNGNGQVIPVGTIYPSFSVSDFIPVREGDTFYVGAHFFWNANYAIPAGITFTPEFGIFFYNAAGSYLGSVLCSTGANAQGYNNTGPGAAPVTSIGSAPAGTAKALILFQLTISNSNSGTVTIPAGNNFPAIVYCNGVFVYQQANLDSDVSDGTTYARLAALDSTPVGGVNRIKLGVAGSGAQVGDQRNLLPILSAGAQAVWQNLSITYTAAAGTPATATISVTAAQILGLIAAGGLVSYNASSASVTGTGGTSPTYYLYYLDPAYSGGTQTLYATTVPNNLRGQLGIVYIGSVVVTFPTSGSGSGGGGGGLCIADDMLINDGLRAGDAREGDAFDCVDLPTGQHKHRRALVGVTRGIEECVRIVSSQGAALVCSISTPFDTPDGRTLLAPDMLGEEVLTDRGIERVASVVHVGSRPVSRIHLGGVSYAAGEDARHRIYSHNGTLKP